MPLAYDALILGRGIAGAVLAEVLRQRGLRVHVFDEKRIGNASMAAAGLVNPLVLRRDVLSWKAAELLPLAEGFYSAWEQRLGVAFWHRLPMVKIFPTPHEADQWQRAMADPQRAPYAQQLPQPELDAAAILAPHGYGTIPHAAWADVPVLLEAQRAELLKDRALSERLVEEDEVQIANGDVRIGAIRGRWLIRCTGPFADTPGLVPVKGGSLVVRIPGLRLTRMVHRGVFLMPLGDDRFRVGATFSWDRVWEGPTDEARAWLLAKLAAFVQLPVEVLGHPAGVRPASRDRRPILGITGPQQAVFNGLGSRGVLLAPWSAMQLADHLFAGKAFDPEVRHDRAALLPSP
jgi:glycine/D-amino acid oxidase-like deaminating enzyme